MLWVSVEELRQARAAEVERKCGTKSWMGSVSVAQMVVATTIEARRDREAAGEVVVRGAEERGVGAGRE